MADTAVIFSILATEKISETLRGIPGSALLSGAAIGAALMGGLNKAIDQESAGNLLAAQLGATPEMSASFGKIAGNLYSQNFGESVADIDDALKGVMQNHLLPEDAIDADIQRVTGKVINSAKLMGAGYDEMTRAVSTMLKTGMAGSADEAFDILTRGMQQGVNKSQDLLDTFTEYPTEFRKLGISGTQAMGLLSQAVQGGARDSDKAADALKEFAIRAVDGSVLTAQGFKMIGLNAKTMAADIGAGGPRAAAALDMTMDRLRAIKDPVKQAQAATALFGTQAEDLGAALFAMDPSNAVMAMGKVGGAADKAGAQLSQGAGAQLETFKRQLEQGFVSVIGGKVVPVLDHFGVTIQKVGDWGQKNWSWLGPVLVFLGTFAGIIGTIVVAYKVWTMVTAAYTAVQTALNFAMMANPIGLIIIAIVALVAAFLYLWFHSAAFRDFWIGLWGAIWGFLKAIGAWFAGPFAHFFVDTWHWLVRVGVAVVDDLIGKWNKFKAFLNAIPGAVRTALFNMWNGLKDGFKAAINFIIRGWNHLHFKMPSFDTHVPGIGKVGGFDVGLPQLPLLDIGGDVLKGGLAVIHQGERVVPAAQVRNLPTGGGATTVVLKVSAQADSLFASMVHKAVRDGLLQLQLSTT
jgi:hypothetical protein